MRRLLSSLPKGWSEPDFVEDAFVADGVLLRRAGVSSTGPGGEEISGAAVECHESASARASFELLERVSTVEALGSKRPSYVLRDSGYADVGARAVDKVFHESAEPLRWRYARSNGVALHADWFMAAERAAWELAERDRVLRAWLGEGRPRRLEFVTSGTPLAETRSYEWLAYEFPEARANRCSTGIRVVGLFGFPRRAGIPLISGYAARDTLDGAQDGALREAMQLLGFLWGEPVLEKVPDLTPTPLHHLEHFQSRPHQEVLRRWLEEGHEKFRGSVVGGPAASDGSETPPDIAFVDLTPSWLGGGLRVAKAVSDIAMPLIFGESPFMRHLPPELRVHPIA